MEDKVAARRYAEGLLSYAKENIGLKKAFEEITLLKEIIASSVQLNEFLQNPEITFIEKCSFIDKALGKSFSEEAINFLKLIIEKGRIAELAHIADYSRIIYYHEIGIEKAVLKSGLAIKKDLLHRIKEGLQNRLHKELELEVKIEPSLIGGIESVVGNIVIDATVKGQLVKLREHLMAIRIS